MAAKKSIWYPGSYNTYDYFIYYDFSNSKFSCDKLKAVIEKELYSIRDYYGVDINYFNRFIEYLQKINNDIENKAEVLHVSKGLPKERCFMTILEREYTRENTAHSFMLLQMQKFKNLNYSSIQNITKNMLLLIAYYIYHLSGVELENELMNYCSILENNFEKKTFTQVCLKQMIYKHPFNIPQAKARALFSFLAAQNVSKADMIIPDDGYFFAFGFLPDSVFVCSINKVLNDIKNIFDEDFDRKIDETCIIHLERIANIINLTIYFGFENEKLNFNPEKYYYASKIKCDYLSLAMRMMELSQDILLKLRSSHSKRLRETLEGLSEILINYVFKCLDNKSDIENIWNLLRRQKALQNHLIFTKSKHLRFRFFELFQNLNKHGPMSLKSKALRIIRLSINETPYDAAIKKLPLPDMVLEELLWFV